MKSLKKRDLEGKLYEEPISYRGCHSWYDAWMYCFRRGFLSAPGRYEAVADQVKRVAWVGADFNDGIVEALKKIDKRLGENTDLRELRLIRTRVTQKGVEQLKQLFPKAIVKEYSEEEVAANPHISRFEA